MSLPSTSPKHTFLPLTAEPRPRYDNTSSSPPTTSHQPMYTPTTEKFTSSSQENQPWYPTPPPNTPSIALVPQTSMAEQVFHPSLPPKAIAKEGEETYTTNTTEVCDKLSASPWSVPHVLEHQKHTWYGSMLGMDVRKVKDEWGFSSATVSRAHTPVLGGGQ
jgi:hypothetical protein